MRDFCQAAFDHVGLDYHKYVEVDPKLVRPAEVDLLVGDGSKAHRLLGWRPTITFEELVAMMVDADMGRLQAAARGEVIMPKPLAHGHP